MVAVQIETGSGSARATSYHDWLNKRVSFMTGRHVATVDRNAGGTGYAVGDIIRLTTNTGAHLEARFEVTSVTGGVIDAGGLRIVSNGSYGDRVNGTVTISAGGTGYPTSVTDLVLELQGGTSRMPAKFLATTNGSGVVTSAVLFEDLGSGGGGVYSVLPSYPAATTAVGPNGVTGSGCTITMGGSTGIIGTTALATTAVTGSGTGATVDVTLAETGWSVDGRNTNRNLINGVDNEKQVVLKGDASGATNKPFIAYATATEDVALNTHAAIVNLGLIAHNPALDLSAHNPISTGLSGETAINGTTAASVMMPDSGAGFDEVDLWMAADDTHFREVAQVKESAATSDDGVYMHHYAGLLDRIGTETEQPYPLYIFGSTRDITTPADTISYNHAGIVQQVHGGNGVSQLYDNASGTFETYRNADAALNPGTEPRVVLPNALIHNNDGGAGGTQQADFISIESQLVQLWGDDDDGHIFDNEANNAVPTRVLRWIPGTSALPFLWPLTLAKKTSDEPDPSDRFQGNIKGFFWISSDNGSGNRIANFSEDYVTINNTRYIVFHSAGRNQAYHYVAFEVN